MRFEMAKRSQKFIDNGRCYLGAANEFQARHSTCLAISDSIAVHTGFVTKRCSVLKSQPFFRTTAADDGQVALETTCEDSRQKPAVAKIDFYSQSRRTSAARQPFVSDWRPKPQTGATLK
jgi:hypothetical protein